MEASPLCTLSAPVLGQSDIQMMGLSYIPAIILKLQDVNKGLYSDGFSHFYKKSQELLRPEGPLC